MVRRLMLSVPEARAALEILREATQAADPNLLVPTDGIRRFHDVVRSIAPREDQYRYRVDGFHGVTMGRLHRNVVELVRDFDWLVEENPRLTRKTR